MRNVAVLMTVFNRINLTINCLNKFYEATKLTPEINYRIFLVDDESTDETSEKIKTLFPLVNIIKGNGQLFWCRGMIKAWQFAEDNFKFNSVLLLNNDSFLYEEGLKKLMSDSEEANNKAIISGAFQSDITKLPTYGGRLKGQISNLIPNNHLQMIQWLNGNCVLIPNSVYKVIGKLDPTFHHAIGDYDYGLRANKRGIDVLLTKSYIGTCEDRDKAQGCYDKHNSMLTRIKIFYSPLGDNPFQRWIFLKRHYSTYKALFSFFITHLMVLFPSFLLLFNNLKKNDK